MLPGIKILCKIRDVILFLVFSLFLVAFKSFNNVRLNQFPPAFAAFFPCVKTLLRIVFQKIRHFGEQILDTGLKCLKRTFKPFQQQCPDKADNLFLGFCNAPVRVFVI